MQGDAITDHTEFHRPSPPQNGELHCYLLYVYSMSPHACPRMRTDVYTRVLSDVYISVLSDVYMSDLCASLCVPFCFLIRILACAAECIFILELRRQIMDTRRNTHICQWLNTHSLPPSLSSPRSRSRARSLTSRGRARSRDSVDAPTRRRAKRGPTASKSSPHTHHALALRQYLRALRVITLVHRPCMSVRVVACMYQ